MEYRAPQEIPVYVASGRERLERLADLLDDLLPGRLSFTRWYGQGTGCAVGLAAVDPWFQAQGLCLERAGSLKDCKPVYQRKSDWRAVTAFFDITLEEARRLFDKQGYGGEMRPHPRRVAEQVRRHLAQAARRRERGHDRESGEPEPAIIEAAL